MSANLLDSLTGVFTKELIGKAASSLGESESSVSKAVTASIPALLSSFMSSSSSDGGSNLLNMAKQAASSGVLDNLGGLFSGGSSSSSMGGNLLSSLLGGSKLSGLASLISGFSGMKQNNVSSLLGSIAPIALGFLGKHAISNNLSAGGLLSWLTSQKSSINAAVPSGLNLSSVFDGASSAVNAAASEVGKAGNNWLMPLLLGLLALGLGWYFMKGCKNEGGTGETKKSENEAVAPVTPGSEVKSEVTNIGTKILGKLDTLSGEFIYDEGGNIKLPIPGTKDTISVGENSTENRLYRFLTDKSATIDTAKGNWFDFTHLRFKSGTTDMVADSETQLKNIAAIIKAFPTATFKIGGYTDNVGDAAKNKELSQKRADAVKDRLMKLGVAATSLTGAVGYGAEYPVGDNNTAEGKAQNRRVAVNVKSK